jgi:hypothetical protein
MTEMQGNVATRPGERSLAPATLPRLGRGTSLVIGGALAILALVEARIAWPTGADLQDFGAFLGAGRALRAGLNPYGVLPTTPRVLVAGQLVPWPNANPPTLLPLLVLAAPADPLGAMRAWYLVSLAVYGVFLVVLLRAYPTRRTLLGLTWLVALFPLWESEARGQIYVALALITAVAWLALRRGHQRRAGVLIGVLTALKPNLAVWPATLLLAGYLAPALVAALVALALAALPLALYGPTIYVEWLGSITTNHGVSLVSDGSVFGLAALLGHQEWTLPLGLVLSLLLLTALALWARAARPDAIDLSARALVVALLVGPITWHGYALLLLPIYLSRRWTRATLASAALTMLPPTVLPALAMLGVDLL